MVLTPYQIHTASGIDFFRLFFRSAVQPAYGIMQNIPILIHWNNINRLHAKR